jgi:hypothetical protein
MNSTPSSKVPSFTAAPESVSQAVLNEPPEPGHDTKSSLCRFAVKVGQYAWEHKGKIIFGLCLIAAAATIVGAPVIGGFAVLALVGIGGVKSMGAIGLALVLIPIGTEHAVQCMDDIDKKEKAAADAFKKQQQAAREKAKRAYGEARLKQLKLVTPDTDQHFFAEERHSPIQKNQRPALKAATSANLFEDAED